MTVTLTLKPDTADRLRRHAARQGQTLADYLQTLADADASSDKDSPNASHQGLQKASEVFARYERHELTHGEAAALLGLTRAEFLNELGRRGLSPFQYGVAEVLAEAGLG